MNKEVRKISRDRFELDSSMIEDRYYVNGQYYFDVPRLTHGMYISYKGPNDAYPSLDFLDNREGLKDEGQDERLPIAGVKEILIYDDCFLAVNETRNAIMFNNGSYEINQTDRAECGEGAPKRHIVFNPIVWDRDFLHNLTERYIGINDHNITGNDETNGTRIISGITRIALVSYYENRSKRNVLIGSTLYSYFVLDLLKGDYRWLSPDEYYDLLKRMNVAHGNITFLDVSFDYLVYEETHGRKKFKAYHEFGV
jgi:hypothetical protein